MWKKPGRRKLRVCPVKGCTAKPQRRLSNHLTYAHPHLSPRKRKRHLKLARIVPDKMAGRHVLRQLIQRSLTASVAGELQLQKAPESSEVEDVEEESIKVPVRGGATRSFDRFDVDLPIFSKFIKWNTSMDGGCRSEKSAREIAVDVSKFMKWCSPDKPSWNAIITRWQVLQYVDKLENAGCGPEGIIQKLDAIKIALKYIQAKVADNDPSHKEYIRCQQIINDMGRYYSNPFAGNPAPR